MESSENRLNLARLYFRKARADLESAKHLISFAQYANAVFLAQQCGEKSAKATLALKNIQVREHVVSGIWRPKLSHSRPKHGKRACEKL